MWLLLLTMDGNPRTVTDTMRILQLWSLSAHSGSIRQDSGLKGRTWQLAVSPSTIAAPVAYAIAGLCQLERAVLTDHGRTRAEFPGADRMQLPTLTSVVCVRLQVESCACKAGLCAVSSPAAHRSLCTTGAACTKIELASRASLLCDMLRRRARYSIIDGLDLKWVTIGPPGRSEGPAVDLLSRPPVALQTLTRRDHYSITRQAACCEVWPPASARSLAHMHKSIRVLTRALSRLAGLANNTALCLTSLCYTGLCVALVVQPACFCRFPDRRHSAVQLHLKDSRCFLPAAKHESRPCSYMCYLAINALLQCRICCCKHECGVRAVCALP